MSFKGFATETVPLQEPDANLGGFLRCVAAQSAAPGLRGRVSRLLGAWLQPATPWMSPAFAPRLPPAAWRLLQQPPGCVLAPAGQDCPLLSTPTCHCSTLGASGRVEADWEGLLCAGSLQTTSNILAAPVNACWAPCSRPLPRVSPLTPAGVLHCQHAARHSAARWQSCAVPAHCRDRHL